LILLDFLAEKMRLPHFLPHFGSRLGPNDCERMWPVCNTSDQLEGDRLAAVGKSADA